MPHKSLTPTAKIPAKAKLKAFCLFERTQRPLSVVRLHQYHSFVRPDLDPKRSHIPAKANAARRSPLKRWLPNTDGQLSAATHAARRFHTVRVV
jgi:hypothetical protein